MRNDSDLCNPSGQQMIDSGFLRVWAEQGVRMRERAEMAEAKLEAIRACYQRHIFDKGLTAEMLDPVTLEGEVWESLIYEGRMK